MDHHTRDLQERQALQANLKIYNNREFKKPDNKDNSSYKYKSASQYLGLVHFEQYGRSYVKWIL